MTWSPDDMAAHVATIANLTRGEIDGYEAHARERGMFPGEMAALLGRRNALGMPPMPREVAR